jgi:AcrR family transcriptional regulator
MQNVTVPHTHAGATRTRDQAKLQRPGEILEAAFAEFQQKGYAATRLDDVARRVGVSKGTIYIYFENKEELFRAVVRSLVNPSLDRVEEATAAFEGSATDLLRRYLQVLYREVGREPRGRGLLRLLIAESETFPELTEVYHREVMSRGHAAMSAILRRGVDAGEFRADAPVDLPHIIIAPVMMLAMHRMLFGDRHPLPVDTYIESHIALVLAGLRAA